MIFFFQLKVAFVNRKHGQQFIKLTAKFSDKMCTRQVKNVVSYPLSIFLLLAKGPKSMAKL